MSSSDANLAEIVKKSESWEALREVLDCLAARQREPRNSLTQAKNLRWKLSERGKEIDVPEIGEVLRFLAEKGYGEFAKGRPLGKSRIIWSESVLELATRVQKLRSDSGPKTTKNFATNSNSDIESASYEVFNFPVRQGIQQELRLRADFTADELNNLADFIRIMARSRQVS